MIAIMKRETTFGELQIGEAFHFRGVRYVKRALACAEDARKWAHVFLVETVVESDGEDGDGSK